jgi:ribonucleoside-diphosphate reductase alpha subunit
MFTQQVNYVIKRDGKRVPVDLNEVLNRVRECAVGLNVDALSIAARTVGYIRDDVNTSELDSVSVRMAEHNGVVHPDYLILASRIHISNFMKLQDRMHQLISRDEECMKDQNRVGRYALLLTKHKHANGETIPIIADNVYEYINKNQVELENMIDFSRNYKFSYQGFKLLEDTYLLKSNAFTNRDRIVECPQLLYIRVAVAVNFGSNDSEEEILNNIKITYDLLSKGYYTHATPTLFHAGLRRPQLASCYLVKMKEDSIEGIYDTVKMCAILSKHAGGIGLSIHEIRSAGSYIRGTCGYSNGVANMLRVFNETMKYVDQCFKEGTPVMTREGYKPIDKLAIGDFVLTSDGCFNQVLNVMDFNVNKKIYTIKANSDAISVSGKHPILSYKKGNLDIVYNKVRDLCVGDYIAHPICGEEVVVEHDISHSWFQGIFMNRGCITDNWVVRLNIEEEHQLYMNMITYLEYHKIEYTYKDDHFNITLFQRLRIPINKQMLTTSIYKMSRYPYYHVEAFIDGYVKSLSYTNSKYLNTSCVTTNTKYARELQLIFYRICNAAVVNNNSLIIPIDDKISNLLNLGKSKHLFYRYTNTYILVPIVSIDVSDKQHNILYDLEIMNDSSYTTPLGVVHNGGGKRKGNCAVYIEPHHADILEFLNLKSPSAPGIKAEDLFYAMWISDTFMECVEQDKDWYLMCPESCPGLNKVYGDEYKKLYYSYVEKGMYKKKIKAVDLFKIILQRQLEKGVPYIMYKDVCNEKSNHNHLGTIESSNLCSEIVQYTSKDETAVCNLASIALPMFCKEVGDKYEYDYMYLYETTRIVCRNLDRLIDINYYPIMEARNSNMRHRPMGIGVQGLANVYMLLGIPFDSDEAYKVNRKIFETMYFAALTESCELAKKYGPYPTFEGSLLSKGIFHWELSLDKDKNPMTVSSELNWDWEGLRRNIKFGVRNSLLIALMPTGSTSQILGNIECFEPMKSNIFQRGNKVGDFIVVNRVLVDSLMKLGLWNDNMAKQIEEADGMIGEITSIPKHIRELYKCIWEIDPKHVINQSIERGAFVDQAASMNLFFVEPTIKKMSQCQFHIWRRRHKNGNYYVHTRPEKTRKVATQTAKNIVCTDEVCISCQS